MTNNKQNRDSKGRFLPSSSSSSLKSSLHTKRDSKGRFLRKGSKKISSLDLLKRTKSVLRRYKWLQGRFIITHPGYIDKGGTTGSSPETQKDYEHAEGFCLVGAMNKACFELGAYDCANDLVKPVSQMDDPPKGAYIALQNALFDFLGKKIQNYIPRINAGIPVLNDSSYTTKADIMKSLDDAIKKLEKSKEQRINGN